VNHRETKSKRSAEEIRSSLEATKAQIDDDLDTLSQRFQKRMVLRQAAAHPLLLAAAGAVVGFLVVKRPTMLLRAAKQLARWSAPLLVSSLLRLPSSSHVGETGETGESPPPTDEA
jgi:hypothetical protein